MSETTEETRQRLIRDGLLDEREPLHNQAVAIVDSQNGYSIEFDSDPEGVRAAYQAEEERLAKQIADALSPAQTKMLCEAAGNYKVNRRQTMDTNRTFVGAGQASTAKKLQSLGLGAYDSNGYDAKFWVHERGYQVAATLGVTPRERS